MYYYPYHYDHYPPPPVYQGYDINQPFSRTYPPVDVKIFTKSVASFRLLMEQGSILLDRLADVGFAQKMMSSAQQGKKAEVDQLIHSIGLKVPVYTKYTPTGVHFELSTIPETGSPFSCCTLAVSMKWGR